eukprot:jgi/Bigna1/75518/fgenesh1_pg.35_\
MQMRYTYAHEKSPSNHYQKLSKLHDLRINGLSWNPFGEYLLATCSDDKTVALWDLRNLDGGKLFSLDHLKPVNSVRWSSLNETILASAGEERRAVIWDLSKVTAQVEATAEMRFVHGGHTDAISRKASCRVILMCQDSRATRGVSSSTCCFDYSDIDWHPEEDMLLASVAKNSSLHIWRPGENVHDGGGENSDE